MTVDSRYFIQPIANDGKTVYIFEMESIGEEALKVYIIDPSPDPEPAEEPAP